MNALDTTLLAWLADMPEQVLHFHRGIEKEGLRVSPSGQLRQTAHPLALGRALTHPYITTDYSEALLELITPVSNHGGDNLKFLEDLHRFIYERATEDIIWSASMPPSIAADTDVPIADYGSSNLGRLKHLYRHGLWHRYGRTMQSIAGIHYNFSVTHDFMQRWQHRQQTHQMFQDFVSTTYFDLIRAFRLHSWLLMYLFGASPVADHSFARVAPKLLPVAPQTIGYPYATSLRMSDVGYSSRAQAQLAICFNSLPSYLQTLHQAINTPYPEYEAIGLRDGEHYKQINTHILQIENEYYSDIRPKRSTERGEKPIVALHNRGVEYIEVRCLDVNPFLPLGIDQSQIDFLNLFLFACLLQQIPSLSDEHCREAQHNLMLTLTAGRDPATRLWVNKQPVALKTQGLRILDALQSLAETLDAQRIRPSYVNSLNAQRAKLEDPEQLPSARVIHALQSSNTRYAHWALNQSKAHKESLCSRTLEQDKFDALVAMAQQSIAQQQQLERESQMSFDDYLAAYQQQSAVLPIQ